LNVICKQVGLAYENILAHEEIAQLKSLLENENAYLKQEIKSHHNFEEIIGASAPMEEIKDLIRIVSPTRATILLRGETGTGKELIARAIHNLSPQKNKALVKVNCAAIPGGLLESELFGHEKGAFTDASSRKIGQFEWAHGGTLFLDEIGSLSPDLQAKLLRVLQKGEFVRLGSESTTKVDVRIIAATHKNLEQAIQEGTFREDLYFRLNVIPIFIPPLRDRKDDIPDLAYYYLKIISPKLLKEIETIPKCVIAKLLSYCWPGNIRELENILLRAIITSPKGTLELDKSFPPQYGDSASAAFLNFHDMERAHIQKVLKKTQWKIRGKDGAADILGLKPTTLESKMQKLGIRRFG